MQYQRELELLERENKILKQKFLLKDAGEQKRLKKLKVSGQWNLWHLLVC